ncbi:hypothetical protein LSH36_83g03005 [Paralvinella palmiformis]|uniref:Uncharacterized protein n=1 Tax=Paralvinella palmiformis TaxID=53620 RepID=A0AAD9NCK2_9ANNE|nr:hypothetical protein LSH36_83g03005 [Paralvinella palmiformis]
MLVASSKFSLFQSLTKIERNKNCSAYHSGYKRPHSSTDATSRHRNSDEKSTIKINTLLCVCVCVCVCVCKCQLTTQSINAVQNKCLVPDPGGILMQT